mmetsp:Transcript_156010/g.276724  ORF Transcript_156010/g.276724 Transcript_156010/m.276724 type:complete len:154 (-) Transcript_156010:92-553(-)
MISEANYGQESDLPGQRTMWVRNVIECIEVGMWCKERDWFVFDNFMVRTFSGIGHTVPPGGVNSSHVHAAMKVLQSFDLVLLMNRLDDPRTSRAYERTIGWPFPLHGSDKSTRVNEGGDQVDLHAQAEIITRLTEINAFDLQFFEFAEQMYYL